jgi:hypothetical protein
MDETVGGDPMDTARKFDDANPSVVYTDMTEHSPTDKGSQSGHARCEALTLTVSLG